MSATHGWPSWRAWRRSGSGHSVKRIFLHIPKTAGTSLNEILQRVYGRDGLVRIYSHEDEHLREILRDVERADAISGHLSFGIHEYFGIEARYVTFLRHPVARVVSLFLHQARHPDNDLHHRIAGGMTLMEILRSGEFPEYNNHMVRIVTGLTSVEPLDDPSLVDAAESTLGAYFDFVGITEHFDESVRSMSDALGWKPQAAPRLNVTPDRETFALDDETLSEILRCNALDADLYRRVLRDHHLGAVPTAS